MQKIYLDYAASTPPDEEVLKVVNRNLKEVYGNPGSLHSFGQKAVGVLDKSREVIANILNADFREIIFTSSATEANNLALRGAICMARKFIFGIGRLPAPAIDVAFDSRVSDSLIKHQRDQVRRRFKTFSQKTSPPYIPKVIISAIEHESVMQTALDLEREGLAEVIVLPVDKRGFILPKDVENILDERTILVSVMYANNVVGSIQPIAEIAKVIGNWKLKIGNAKAVYPLLHTDAVQAFQYLDCDTRKLGVDLLTLSSHKIYGPKGAGALCVKQTKSRQLKTLNSKPIGNFGAIAPIITGGDQEFGLRSATQAVPLIAGFACAAKKADQARIQEVKRSKELKTHLLALFKKHLPKVQINGGTGNNFLPNIVNLSIPGKYTSGELLVALDMQGIAVSSGAACSVRSEKPSYVLQALGIKENRAKSSIRISMGKFTTKTELFRAVSALKQISRGSAS